MDEPWTEADRALQLVKLAHCAEFNLVWDHGTRFGVQTSHKVQAVLMSLPPVPTWP